MIPMPCEQKDPQTLPGHTSLNDNTQLIVFLHYLPFTFPKLMLDLWNFLLFHSTDIRPEGKGPCDAFDAKMFRNACIFWAGGWNNMRCSKIKERTEGAMNKGEGKMCWLPW